MTSSVRFDDEWKDTGYAQVPNNILRDRELSWKAKGIIAYLASHTEHMKMTRSFLMGGASDGETSFRSGMKELREAGYVSVVRVRDNDGGFTDTVYVLHRYRRSDPESGKPTARGSHDAVNDAQKKTRFKEDQVKEDQDISLDLGLPASKNDAPTKAIFPSGLFDHFWQVVPKKTGKQGAKVAWERAVRRSAKEHQGDYAAAARVIWRAMAQYQRQRVGQPLEYTKNPETWLNKGCWEDEHAAAPRSTSNGYKPYKDRDHWGTQEKKPPPKQEWA